MQHEKEKYKKEAKSVGAWPVFKKRSFVEFTVNLS
jgi:hypothetical protein